MQAHPSISAAAVHTLNGPMPANRPNLTTHTMDPYKHPGCKSYMPTRQSLQQRSTHLLCFSREFAGWLITKKSCNFKKNVVPRSSINTHLNHIGPKAAWRPKSSVCNCTIPRALAILRMIKSVVKKTRHVTRHTITRCHNNLIDSYASVCTLLHALGMPQLHTDNFCIIAAFRPM